MATELADGRTFFDITISSRGFRYARKAEVRAAILRELRRYAIHERLQTTAQRTAIADAVMADEQWLRRCSGMVMAAIARDVIDEVLDGRWR